MTRPASRTARAGRSARKSAQHTAALPPTLDLDFARARRCGLPEAVFGAGKTVEEILAAATRLHAAHGKVLITRAAPAALAALTTAFPHGESSPRSGCFSIGAPAPHLGPVAIVTAGTADEPVAEESALTLTHAGVRVVRCRDCGVAGLHRLLPHLPQLRRAHAVIVIAGMEGALPSVVGGLIDRPLIAVPSPVGYGIAAGGRVALEAMLSSCAAGITVVNIGNGYGAGCAAAAICRVADLG